MESHSSLFFKIFVSVQSNRRRFTWHTFTCQPYIYIAVTLQNLYLQSFPALRKIFGSWNRDLVLFFVQHLIVIGEMETAVFYAVIAFKQNILNYDLFTF